VQSTAAAEFWCHSITTAGLAYYSVRTVIQQLARAAAPHDGSLGGAGHLQRALVHFAVVVLTKPDTLKGLAGQSAEIPLHMAGS